MCRWQTTRAGVNVAYPNGEVGRNVDYGIKGGSCLGSGDSGGPIYTVRPDGGIAAKGILSGRRERDVLHEHLHRSLPRVLWLPRLALDR